MHDAGDGAADAGAASGAGGAAAGGSAAADGSAGDGADDAAAGAAHARRDLVSQRKREIMRTYNWQEATGSDSWECEICGAFWTTVQAQPNKHGIVETAHHEGQQLHPNAIGRERCWRTSSG